MFMKIVTGTVVLLLAGIGGACTQDQARFPDVESQVEQSLESSGFQNVSASQDREHGTLTLSGEVPSETDKMRAEEIAKTAADGQVVVNEIAVRPERREGQADDVQSSLDDAIEENFQARLEQNNIDGVDYDANEGVLTLTGEVKTMQQRQQVERLAAAVPNVEQVVNKLEVEGQPATSTTAR